MGKPLIIFGVGEMAELAHHYFASDSGHEVAAFTVDAEFIQADTFRGLPLIPFGDLARLYPPSKYSLFLALGYTAVNKLRRSRFEAAKAMGYTLESYISSRTTFLSDTAVGENCFILEDNTIQPFVHIGDNVVLWSGNHIGHHVSIGDHAFITSQVVISGGCKIGERVFIGVNATLRDHISIGEGCVIGAGTLILSDADPDGVYIGAATPRSTVPSGRLRRI